MKIEDSTRRLCTAYVSASLTVCTAVLGLTALPADGWARLKGLVNLGVFAPRLAYGGVCMRTS